MNETKVPFQAEINFEAAWKSLYTMLDNSEQMFKLMLPVEKREQYTNPILTAMKNLQEIYTIEVPIQ
jgi:hypothetical protein